MNDGIERRQPVRVLWWARRFGEPLRQQYPIDDSPVFDEWTELLDQADRRQARAPEPEK